MDNAIDGIIIFNCGFKFQNVTHLDTFKQYEIAKWLDYLAKLVQQLE